MGRILIAIGVTLVIAVVAAFLIQRFQRANLPIQIGLSVPIPTNDVTGAPVVVILLTNVSERPVRRWGHYGVETRQTTWQQNAQHSMGPTLSLRPGQVESLMVPVPTNGRPWKAVLFCSKEDWRTRSAGLPGWLRWLTGRRGGIPTEVIPTEWIE